MLTVYKEFTFNDTDGQLWRIGYTKTVGLIDQPHYTFSLVNELSDGGIEILGRSFPSRMHLDDFGDSFLITFNTEIVTQIFLNKDDLPELMAMQAVVEFLQSRVA